MKKISEYLFLWGIGGWIYYTLEILFRGFSHWSMFVRDLYDVFLLSGTAGTLAG